MQTDPDAPETPLEPLVVTQDELAATFTEWDRRYREEPERFMSEAVHLLRETAETYGQACAPYFTFLLEELRAARGGMSDPIVIPLVDDEVRVRADVVSGGQLVAAAGSQGIVTELRNLLLTGRRP